MEQQRLPAAERADWEHVLDGVDFPISKVALIRDVEDRGGIDREVIEMVESLPADEYEDIDSLREAVRRAYRDAGYADDVIPV